jgi:hypothetical protein
LSCCDTWNLEAWKWKKIFLLIFFVEVSTICILINHTLCTFDNIYLGIPMSIDLCDRGFWKQNVIKSNPWCCLKMANVDPLRWFVFVWDKIGNIWNDVQGVLFQFKEKLKNSFFWSIVKNLFHILILESMWFTFYFLGVM